MPPPQQVPPSVSMYRLSHKVPGKASKAFKRATVMATDGRPQESIALLEEALKQDADYADALHLRGLYAYQYGDFEQAAVLLHRAAKLDSDNPIFLADAAVGQLTVRNAVEAERCARAALRLSPLHKRALDVLNRLKP